MDSDGSPETMISLLLSRAIAGLFPTTENAIRIALCVNQRKALRIKADACRCPDVGDLVLKRVAEVLKYSFRSTDLVFRLGGDEFVTKPFSPQVLVARIKALLRTKEQIVDATPEE